MSFNKCQGCGAEKKNDQALCERCFRIKNYSEYTYSPITNKETKEIISKEIESNQNVFLILDILFFTPEQIETLYKDFNLNDKKVTVIFNKVDLLPKQVSRERIKMYFEVYFNHLQLNFEKIFISSFTKNEMIDEIYNYSAKINGEIYLLGYANTGKSTLINQLLKSKGLTGTVLSSVVPGTTVQPVVIENEEIKFVDLPGIINEQGFDSIIALEELKLLLPSSEIKAKTYQLNAGNGFWLDNQVHFSTVEKANVTVFVSNQLYVHRTQRDDLEVLNDERFALQNSVVEEWKTETIELPNDGSKVDIVFEGLGFVSAVAQGQEFKIKINSKSKINLRESYFNK